MDLSANILETCWRWGVREMVLCAGARNAPLVTQLSGTHRFSVHSFFEERSGAFFALGKILGSQRPVAVITTSGTAVAELLPAVIEADHQGLPLVVISADRPRRYRGSGAPQAINQIGLFSHYVEQTWDVEGAFITDPVWSRRRPVHVNVCFDEPLIDGPVRGSNEPDEAYPASAPRISDAGAIAVEMHRPLVLVGGIPLTMRAKILPVLRQWGRPLYMEGPSNLRGASEIAHLEIRGGEKSVAEIAYDGVIRVGGVPTLRRWRDLEKSALPVVHFSHLPFSGLPRVREVHDFRQLEEWNPQFQPWSVAERTADLQRAEQTAALLLEFPLSEPAWVGWLSRILPAQARVFVGNSLPIREWDFAASRDFRGEVFANRGVNGIDGLISTFLGLSDRTKSNWGVIGDLSALYDLSAPWSVRDENATDLNLVVINNGGGKIFQRMFRNSLFENHHDLNFADWARMWHWDYLRLDSPIDVDTSITPRRRVIEVRPSPAQSEQFWHVWEQL